MGTRGWGVPGSHRKRGLAQGHSRASREQRALLGGSRPFSWYLDEEGRPLRNLPMVGQGGDCVIRPFVGVWPISSVRQGLPGEGDPT